MEDQHIDAEIHCIICGATSNHILALTCDACNDDYYEGLANE